MGHLPLSLMECADRIPIITSHLLCLTQRGMLLSRSDQLRHHFMVACATLDVLLRVIRPHQPTGLQAGYRAVIRPESSVSCQ